MNKQEVVMVKVNGKWVPQESVAAKKSASKNVKPQEPVQDIPTETRDDDEFDPRYLIVGLLGAAGVAGAAVLISGIQFKDQIIDSNHTALPGRPVEYAPTQISVTVTPYALNSSRADTPFVLRYDDNGWCSLYGSDGQKHGSFIEGQEVYRDNGVVEKCTSTSGK